MRQHRGFARLRDGAVVIRVWRSVGREHSHVSQRHQFATQCLIIAARAEVVPIHLPLTVLVNTQRMLKNFEKAGSEPCSVRFYSGGYSIHETHPSVEHRACMWPLTDATE